MGNEVNFERSCYLTMQFPIQVVSTDHFAWLEGPQLWKAVWNSALVGGGELSAMTSGTIQMLPSYVDNLATP